MGDPSAEGKTSCLLCKEDVYFSPQLKLLTPPCEHRICEPCLAKMFQRGSESTCPQCGAKVRRTQYTLQKYMDFNLDRDIQIRRRVLKEFNKTREDFANEDDFYSYEEEVEDIIMNLTNNVDVQRMQEKLEENRRKNRSLIATNQAKKAEQERAKQSLSMDISGSGAIPPPDFIAPAPPSSMTINIPQGGPKMKNAAEFEKRQQQKQQQQHHHDHISDPQEAYAAAVKKAIATSAGGHSDEYIMRRAREEAFACTFAVSFVAAAAAAGLADDM